MTVHLGDAEPQDCLDEKTKSQWGLLVGTAL